MSNTAGLTRLNRLVTNTSLSRRDMVCVLLVWGLLSNWETQLGIFPFMSSLPRYRLQHTERRPSVLELVETVLS